MTPSSCSIVVFCGNCFSFAFFIIVLCVLRFITSDYTPLISSNFSDSKATIQVLLELMSWQLTKIKFVIKIYHRHVIYYFFDVRILVSSNSSYHYILHIYCNHGDLFYDGNYDGSISQCYDIHAVLFKHSLLEHIFINQDLTLYYCYSTGSGLLNIAYLFTIGIAFVSNIYIYISAHCFYIITLYFNNLLIVSLVEFGLLHFIFIVVGATSGVVISCLFQA